jgi:hypothetical protein
VAVFLNHAHDGHGVYGWVGHEADGHDGGGRVNFGDAIGRSQHAQAMHVDERLAGVGQFAKAVHHFLLQVVDLFLGFGRGEFFIQAQAQVHVATVVIGQQGGGVEVDFGGGR